MKLNLLKLIMLLSKHSLYIMVIQLVSMQLVVANATLGQSLAKVKVSISVSNASLEEIIRIVENQTDFVFASKGQMVVSDSRIDLHLRNSNLKHVLEELSRAFQYNFKRVNRNIYVWKQKKSNAKPNDKIDYQVFDRTISGKVTDENNQGLPGVNVLVKHTGIGTITDANGGYRLNVPDDATTLVFSYVGYISEELEIAGRSVIEVQLAPDLSTLSEVVVIGYGTQNKKDLTGAIGLVAVEDMQKAPVASFEEAMGGRIAGVQVSSGEGQPGDNMNIVIRGMGSITQNASPLFVIDGVPFESLPSGLLDPADIKSISVLKDASAAAIYGARGANGVVIVTTKAGVPGKPRITYDGYIGVSEVKNRMALLSPYEYVRLQDELEPGRVDSTYFRKIPGNYFELLGNPHPTRQDSLDYFRAVEPIDWQEAVFQEGVIRSHRVSISGGDKQGTLYNLSFSAFSQEGVIINSGFDRYNGRIKVDQQVSDKLAVGMQANYSRTKQYGTRTSVSGHAFSTYLLPSVLSYRPVNYDPNVDLLNLDIDPDINPLLNYQFNPILSAENEFDETINNNVILNANVQYKILDGLTLKVDGAYNSFNAERDRFNNSFTRSGSPNSTLARGPNGSNRTRIQTNRNVRAFLNYNRKFGQDHTLTLMTGTEMNERRLVSRGFSAFNVIVENNNVNGLDSGTADNIETGATANRLRSYLGRANYSFKDKYMLTASIRWDGSSKFLAKNRWGTFPSFALAWQLGDENFMKSISFIGDAKVRASWGQIGNNRIDDFAAQAALEYVDRKYASGSTIFYAFNNELQLGVVPNRLENQDLRWETVEEANIGLDLGLLENRFNVSLDAYIKTTEDLLLRAQLPTTSGFRAAFKNVGSIENKGLEVTLSAVNIDANNFRWTTDFNIAFNKNKVLSLNEDQTSLAQTVRWSHGFNNISGYVAKVGRPVGQMYGYVWDGIYQVDDFDNAGTTEEPVYVLKPDVIDNGQGRNKVQPGFIKYKDINGDGVLNENDRTVIGDPTPKHMGGLVNNFSYKGIALHVFFQWSYGNDILNANRVYQEAAYRANANLFATVADRWTPDNPSHTMYSAQQDQTGLQNYSSRIIEDGAFLRLKTVSVSYNFPESVISKLRMQSARIYFSAQNLYTWTNYSGYDPEVSVRNSALTRGFDFSAYPRARTMTVGVNFSF